MKIFLIGLLILILVGCMPMTGQQYNGTVTIEKVNGEFKSVTIIFPGDSDQQKMVINDRKNLTKVIHNLEEMLIDLKDVAGQIKVEEPPLENKPPKVD